MGLHLGSECDLGALKPVPRRELESSVAGTTGGGRGSGVAARGLGEYNTNSVKAFRRFVGRVPCFDYISHMFGTLSQSSPRTVRAFWQDRIEAEKPDVKDPSSIF